MSTVTNATKITSIKLLNCIILYYNFILLTNTKYQYIMDSWSAIENKQLNLNDIVINDNLDGIN